MEIEANMNQYKYPKVVYAALPWLYILCALLTLVTIPHPLSFFSGCLFGAAGALVLHWRNIHGE